MKAAKPAKASTTSTIRSIQKGGALIKRALFAFLLLAGLTFASTAAPRIHADGNSGNLPVYTSPIDITGTKLQVRLAVLDRDTGKPIEIPLPLDKLGPAEPPQLQQFFGTPLSTQLDQYWNTYAYRVDDKGKTLSCDLAAAQPQDAAGNPDSKCATPPQHACDQTKVQVTAQIKNIGSGFGAYDISCSFAHNGQVLTTKPLGSALRFAYLLTNNSIEFRATTPVTCNPDHTSYGCLNDPLFTVTFATEISTYIRAGSLCGLSVENATINILGASIDTHNFSGGAAQNLIDVFAPGHQFLAAEAAINNTERQAPLPLGDNLKTFTDTYCKGPNAPLSLVTAPVYTFEPAVERDGIVLRLTHEAIDVPVLRNGDQVIAPSFQRPAVTAPQPVVTAGKMLPLNGLYFSIYNPTLGFVQPSGPECLVGGTELEVRPAGGQAQQQTLSPNADGSCTIIYDGSKLSPSTSYQFRARNCDLFTCSAWSPIFNGATAAGVSSSVTLTLDGAQLGTATIDGKGTFSTTVTIPAATAAGAHTIHAVAGDAKADASIQVSAPAAAGGSNATIVVVGVLAGETGCPLHILTSTQTDAPFLLGGNGFAAGSVTIHLDSASGTVLGTATAGADGTFCVNLQAVPGGQAGKHTLVAVEDGTVVAQDAVTFVQPSVVR